MFRRILRLPPFRTINGRQQLSLWVSHVFEKSGIKRLFGLHLVAAVFFTGIITPQADNLLSQRTLESSIHSTPIAIDPTTKTTFETPLADFRLSQGFSYWHPGIDMAAPQGKPVYAIEWGFVAEAQNSFFGYGKHVLISHEHHIESLYAHLSEIRVKVGQKINRGELIGRIGATGWATGNHLHLEIHQAGVPVNPLDVLPLKLEDIHYDGIYNIAASPPASLKPLARAL